MFVQNSKPNDTNFYKAFQQHRSYLDTNVVFYIVQCREVLSIKIKVFKNKSCLL
uniref:Uncharacterized protein n=1 Tax=Meloidogyne enterolobii TaxID=390850 RepID=A0A6V7UI16_MELEN|nr:unnamed protein product [Meloidogyne enterolobii]